MKKRKAPFLKLPSVSLLRRVRPEELSLTRETKSAKDHREQFASGFESYHAKMSIYDLQRQVLRNFQATSSRYIS